MGARGSLTVSDRTGVRGHLVVLAVLASHDDVDLLGGVPADVGAEHDRVGSLAAKVLHLSLAATPHGKHVRHEVNSMSRGQRVAGAHVRNELNQAWLPIYRAVDSTLAG